MTPKNLIITSGAVAGAAIAVWALWVQLGGAIPVSHKLLYETADSLEEKIRSVEVDGVRQTLESAKWGRKIYNQELHDLLIIPVPENLEQRTYWKESVERARRQRKFYSDKEIELRME